MHSLGCDQVSGLLVIVQLLFDIHHVVLYSYLITFSDGSSYWYDEIYCITILKQLLATTLPATRDEY